MKHLFLTAFILLAACGQDGGKPTLDEIMDRHTEAQGGAALLESVRSVRVALDITEPGFTVTGDYLATREGHMRIDIYADGTRVFTEALGPDGGWQMGVDGTVRDLTAEGLKALERGIVGNLYGLHEREALGYRYRLVGETEHGGTPAFEIEEVAPDGFSKHFYVDARTWHIVGDVKTSALHPDVDSREQRQQTFYTAFMQADGLGYASVAETRDMDTGALMQTVRTNERMINPEIDVAIFNRPNVPLGNE